MMFVYLYHDVCVLTMMEGSSHNIDIDLWHTDYYSINPRKQRRLQSYIAICKHGGFMFIDYTSYNHGYQTIQT